MKKGLKVVASASIIMFAFGVILFIEGIGVASANATMAVDPKVGGKAPSELYSVNITISEITELYAWQFNLTFNTPVLEAVSVVQGPFLKQAGNAMMPTPVLNNTAGYVWVGCSRFPYDKGANGSGVLATVVFRIKAEGKSSLHFSINETWAFTWDGSTLVGIPYTAVDGIFSYPVELVHDVAVTDIAVSSLTVAAGGTVSINVTVLNKGNVTESFDVTLYYDSTVMETRTVSDLISDRSRTVVFEWETRHVAVGDYVLTALASAVDGETSTLNNSFSFAAVKVTEPPAALPIELLGLAVGIVVIVIVTAFLLLRKRGPKQV